MLGDKLQNTSWIFGQKEIIYAKFFLMIQDKKQRIYTLSSLFTAAKD